MSRLDMCVFQMGSVGSNAVKDAIIQAFDGEVVNTVPSVVPEPEGVVSLVPSATDPRKHVSAKLRLWHLHALDDDQSYMLPAPGADLRGGQVTHQTREHIFRHGPLKVVTMVRNPMERQLSTWFRWHQCNGNFWKDYNLTLISEWFDRQLKKYTEIDVYAEPFNIDQGWQIYEHPEKPIEVLLIRTESLDHFDEAMTAFMGMSFESGLGYKPSGRLKGMKFPKQVVSAVEQTQYCQHFYNSEERMKMLEEYSY